MPKMSNNEVPSVIFTEQGSAPSQTAGVDYIGIPTGDQRLYIYNGDHGLWLADSSGVAHKISMEIQPALGGSAPGAATHYMRVTLDGGTTWYRIALSPDS